MKVSEAIEEISLIDEINSLINSAIRCQSAEDMVTIPTDYLPDMSELLARYKCMILDKEIK